MSLSPFATLESRVNDVVERRLANAQGVYQGGKPFGVIFDREGDGVLDGNTVDMASLTAGFRIANTPGLAAGSELVIDGVVHEVAGQVQPDAGGWVTVTVYPKD